MTGVHLDEDMQPAGQFSTYNYDASKTTSDQVAIATYKVESGAEKHELCDTVD